MENTKKNALSILNFVALCLDVVLLTQIITIINLTI